MRTILFTLALAPSIVLAQSDAEIDAEIAGFKAGMNFTCYGLGPKLGYSPEFVDAFCKCRLKAANESMTREQWRELGAMLARSELEQANRVAMRIALRANQVCAKEGTS